MVSRNRRSLRVQVLVVLTVVVSRPTVLQYYSIARTGVLVLNCATRMNMRYDTRYTIRRYDLHELPGVEVHGLIRAAH